MLENFKAELAEYNDPDGESTFYKLKCERITKEQELVKKDLEEKHEDEMNFLRKQFEKKVFNLWFMFWWVISYYKILGITVIILVYRP